MTSRLVLLGASALVTVMAVSPAMAEQPVPLSFTPIELPMTNEAKHGFTASASAMVHGKELPIGYQTIARVGDQLGDGVFGQLVDIKGEPMVEDDGSPKLCNKPDFMTLIPVGDKLFMVNQFECSPAAMYLTEMEQDPATGQLSAQSTRLIDFAAVKGGIRHCAGMLTPWSTHLSSEEDVRDARTVQADGTLDHDNYRAMVAYLGDQAVASPYLWGWIPEVAILDETGATSVVKHYAMGRLSAEIAYALPDERTVFLSEDNTNSPLVMFIADQPRDLSAGTLYAAKFTQTDDQGGGAGDLQWINLGHASSDQVAKLLDDSVTFDQLFDAADPGEDGSCPADFTSINAENKHECLTLRPGMETAASRLETGRYAALMGATTEFRKMEGATFDPDRGQLYVAMSRIQRGMVDGDEKYDHGGNNDVRLTENNCGAVYALATGAGQTDSDGAAIDSDSVFTKMSSIVEGIPREYTEPALAANVCDVDGIAEPDNITYLPGSDVLIIAEDAGRHEIDVIWAYDVDGGELTRIQTTPYGAETTGTYWFPDINGWGYLSSVIQDPFGDADAMPEGEMEKVAAGAERAYVGVIGPFPALTN